MWPSDRVLVVFTVLVGSTLTASGFLSPQALSPASKSIKRSMLLRYQGSRSTWSLSAAKGFGNTPPPPPPPKKSKQSSSASPSSAATTTTTTTPPKAPLSSGSKSEDRMLLENGYNPFLDEQERQPELSQGKAALAKLRRQEAEKRNEELRKIKEVQQVDEMLRESPDAAAIPEKVAQRMGARMLPFVGIPLFGAMGSFVGFWYMATYRDMEFQPALVATVSLVLLAVGLVGITYSIMSASWDPDREGSFLGTDEFSQNLDNIKTGLSRSRENAVLRDKMDKQMYSMEELDRIDNIGGGGGNKRKEPKKSFTDKIGDELE